MTIHIQPNRTISEIREEFNKLFPFLKLEFFKVAHEAQEPSRQRAMITSDLFLSKVIAVIAIA